MKHIILLTAVWLACAVRATPDRNSAVNRAIEQTKRRQSAPSLPNNRTPNRNSAGGKSESLDVDRLNKLLRTLDKTWVLPRIGAKEPVGTNFQYKKTCSSIYKARHGACQQLGFGTMCFNYCHERGEKLSFKCLDTSEASYCKQSGTFDTFIAKYSKDSYKAKAYVHQMISRCFATAVCNIQTGILNSTLIREEEEVQTTTKASRLRITKPAGGFKLPGGITKKTKTSEIIESPVVQSKKLKMKMRKLKTSQTTEAPEVEEAEVEEVELTTQRPRKTTPTAKNNIWDKFTVGKAKATPKYIPFWQKLMSTTLAPLTSDGESEEVEEVEEVQSTISIASAKSRIRPATVNYKVTLPTKKPRMPLETPPPVPEVSATESEIEEEVESTETTVEEEVEETSTTTTTKKPVRLSKNKTSKFTFKPIDTTTPAEPKQPELAFMKPSDREGEEQVPGFWNKFQPGRWYQSIHYMTNTGRK